MKRIDFTDLPQFPNSEDTGPISSTSSRRPCFRYLALFIGLLVLTLWLVWRFGWPEWLKTLFCCFGFIIIGVPSLAILTGVFLLALIWLVIVQIDACYRSRR